MKPRLFHLHSSSCQPRKIALHEPDQRSVLAGLGMVRRQPKGVLEASKGLFVAAENLEDDRSVDVRFSMIRLQRQRLGEGVQGFAQPILPLQALPKLAYTSGSSGLSSKYRR